MSSSLRPIQFRDYLPEVFQVDDSGSASFQTKYLRAFEALFEELEAEIEGTPDQTSGGIPDLFDPAVTPPQQLKYRPEPDLDNPEPDFDFLEYLASWTALPLRAEKPLDWNRAFFKAAIPLYPKRGTLPGIDALLRAWLKGDLLETNPPLLILSDLTPADTDVDAIFQLGVNATLGVNTALGEGPPFFFIADLVTDPTVPELRNPAGLDFFERAARFLLDTEKPAHTYYQLRVRAHTMQLAPQLKQDERLGEVYAQVGQTTLLWDEPWVFNSD
jgi:hypothetical protein